MTKIAVALVVLCLGASGCKSKTRAEKALDKAAAGEKAPPPDLAITVKRVVLADELAPNETYSKNGLGKKAGADHTFVCTEYDVKNGGKKPASAPQPSVIDAKGAEYPMNVDVAGSIPEPISPPLKTGEIAPGDTRAAIACHTLPTSAASGALKLKFSAAGWGDVGPFEKTLDLPAAVPLASVLSASGSAAGSSQTAP